ncbi:MAG: hypothetical protein BWK72_20375 [Rhodoferax ferrireducens]|uniref:Uncharacterized protein n=1 Tax=Rhodoferax ferrireducens TaxID=192843 RepID=A0A1W9KNR2_9BURK|nr:MAG: hypothetical protein BWK72_20375 [Rhodoferax ferrireducens]
MQIIRSAADIVADPALRDLVSSVFANVSDCPEILRFILIVETGDTLASLDAQLGFSIFVNRHEFILEHADWYELVYVLGQDGYGIEVFVPKSIDLPELLAMCVKQALPAESMP